MTKKPKPEYGSAKGMAEIKGEATPEEMGFAPEMLQEGKYRGGHDTTPEDFALAEVRGVLSNDLAAASTEDLRAELARGLSLTAETLMRLGHVWAELERRGEDLSDLRHGLARTLPLIAAGRLAAESVVAFAGRPSILRGLEGVPLDAQRHFANGRPVQVIDPADPQAVQEMPLQQLPAAAIRLVFADGEVRSPQAQRLALRPRRRQQDSERSRRYQPRYDPETGIVTVGKMTIRLPDLLSALASAAGPDRPPASDRPDDYLTVKVRLTRAEHERFQELCRRHELPDWEMIRKALRAFGLIGNQGENP